MTTTSLREIRIDKGVRQWQLAEKMKISQARVARIERTDIKNLAIDTIRRYIEAIGGKVVIIIKQGKVRIEI